MPKTIHELDAVTIDQIAAGEVVERPAGAVKELVENAIDAGATMITIEIEDGGISMLRVTDNGEGIEASQVRKAFLRHATSKIETISDLFSLHSLGFRGEALSSIAAVSRVEMITRTKEALTGVRYCIEGGREMSFEEVGAPEGTTIVARNLFYNTPAREKFLKKPQTEAMHVADLAEHLAIAHPEISFRFISNHTDRFHTSGSGDLKENIYRIFGRDIAASILPIDGEEGGLHLTGYLGKPAINRASRSHELFFVNGRFVRDRMLSAALEEGYRAYLMQHKFPFAVLNVSLPPDQVDVNVHPTKMEVRFGNSFAVSGTLTRIVADTLSGSEMIPDALLDEKSDRELGYDYAERNAVQRFSVPAVAEPFETGLFQEANERADPYTEASFEETKHKDQSQLLAFGLSGKPVVMSDHAADTDPQEGEIPRILSDAARPEYRILGQLFDTYWVIACRDKLLLLDQHAAHEKVNYEKMMKRYHEHETISQMIDPPVIVSLTPAEEEMLTRHAAVFRKLGFEIEAFGARSVAIRGIPLDLYGAADERTFFLEILDELSENTLPDRDPVAVTERIASMACKASVKGNTRMTIEEVSSLLDQMMTLENPYHCPHGRPTLIIMSRYEIDKRFKRVVD